MLFTPEPIRRRRAEIARECQAGTITEADAGAQLTETDPDFGGGYLLLGNVQSAAGDLAGAESSYWNALERMPCDYSAYFALSDVRRRQHGDDDPLSRRLMLLGIWKLALSEDIPDEVVGFFSERMKKLDADFKEPATYEALATALETEGEVPAHIRDRLLPYELLNGVQRQSAEGMNAELLRDTLSHSERLIPLWRAAAREWAERHSALPVDALGLMVALLGETARPEILDDLLELVDLDERTVFLHANWAVWRIGQRFPAETLEKFRSAAATALPALRCILAEHINLLPETPGIEAGLVQLLEGFAGLAQQDGGAAYLLATVIQALNELGLTDQAERVFRQYHTLLPAEAREWVRESADEGLMSRLSDEEIDGLAIEDICLDCILMEDPEEEDREEEEAVAPVVAPFRPGRNEPCWCGSGKKYKKCHLGADEEFDRSGGARAAEAPVAESLEAKLHRELIRCDKEWRGKAALTEAAWLYFGRRLEDLDSPPDGALLGGFFEWYLHEFRPASTGRTLVEEYLRRRAGRLTAAESELLEAWRVARFGIWEAQRIEEGKGVELKDLFAGDRLFVHDVSCSRSMVQWDCVLSRVYRSEGRWLFAGIGISVPRTLLPKLTEQIERESRAAGMSAAAFVRAHSHRWQRVVEELAEEQLAGLRVVNAEGDELEFCAAEYRVQDEALLIAALEEAAPFEAEERDDSGGRSFAWLEQGTEGPRRSYGHIEVRHGRLRLECNSRKRLEIGRQLVEELGGEWLKHRGDSFQSVDALKRRVFEDKQRRRARRESSVPPEVEMELLSKLKSEHYAHWVDEPLPALGGRTPREASRSEMGRRALEDLLRLMENGEERARREGRAAFDFSAVRKTLGM